MTMIMSCTLLMATLTLQSCDSNRVVARKFDGEKVYVKTTLYQTGDTIVLYHSPSTNWTLDNNWLDKSVFDSTGQYTTISGAYSFTYALAVIQ